MNRQQRIELYNEVGNYVFRGLSSLFAMVMLSLFAGVDLFTGLICGILAAYFIKQVLMTVAVGMDVMEMIGDV